MKTGIFYGSTTGNAENAARRIGELLSGSQVISVDHAGTSDFENYDVLILGASTWGLGDLQDDWDNSLGSLSKAKLQGKKVAIFGLGDQVSYPDTFVDGIAKLYSAAVEAGATVVGKWPDEGYDCLASEALEGDFFLGLALDEENQGELTEDRINTWIAQLQTEMN